MPRKPKTFDYYMRYCGKCEKFFKTKARSRGKDLRCKKCGGRKALK